MLRWKIIKIQPPLNNTVMWWPEPLTHELLMLSLYPNHGTHRLVTLLLFLWLINYTNGSIFTQIINMNWRQKLTQEQQQQKEARIRTLFIAMVWSCCKQCTLKKYMWEGKNGRKVWFRVTVSRCRVRSRQWQSISAQKPVASLELRW